MGEQSSRKAFAVANWKMAMTVSESLAFVHEFRAAVGKLAYASVAERIQIIYGGSVAPEYAKELLVSPEVDGLGASRKGRDPITFAKIVRLIATAKGLA